MGRMYFECYKALMHIANETEENVAKAAEVKKASSQYKKTTLAINQVWSYQNSAPYQQACFRYPQEQGSGPNQPIATTQPNQSGNRSRNRPFLKLPATLSKTLDALQAEGILQPLAPTRPPLESQ